MKSKRTNKLLIALFVIFFGAFGFYGCHIGAIFSKEPDVQLIDAAVKGIFHIAESPFLIELTDIIHLLKGLGISMAIYAVIVIGFVFDHQRNKHFKDGEQCGTAQWNDDIKAYNKRYVDPKDNTNMILSQNVKLNMNTRQTFKNNNVAVIGGSGSGKSRFFVKPNILQANCNYVITDPKGELLESTGYFLQKQGYEVKVFNLIEMTKSDCYNPFNYIRDDLGVVMMIKCLIKNTTPPTQKSGDPFWEKSEEALLQALCFYLIKYRPKEERNFSTVMRLLRAAEVNENSPNGKSPLDHLFDEVARTDPDSIALKQYKTFKMGADKTLKSILISCAVRLTVFNLKQVENLTGRDTLELESMGEGKKALFVIIPSADSTYNFLVSMMYSQLFETLYYKAQTEYEGGRLKTPTRFLLDEFANIGEIPEFSKKISTMRSYEISCSIILQNLAQLKTMYKDDWPTILGNCDSFLFLGGQEYETVEYISKELGDATIVVRDRNLSRGKAKSSTRNFKHTSRKLMDPSEIMRLNEKECILMIRALNPFKDKKYDYTKHPNYKLTGDANKKFRYVNEKDNQVYESAESIDIQKEKEKATIVQKSATSPSPASKVVGDIKNVEGMSKTLGVKSSEDADERFVAVRPDDSNTPYINTNESSSRETEDSPPTNINTTHEPPLSDVFTPAEGEEAVHVELTPATEARENESANPNSQKDDDSEPNQTSAKDAPEDIRGQQEVTPQSNGTQNNKPDESKPEKKQYPYNPSEKTQMRNARVNLGALATIESDMSQAEIWDFD